MHPSKYSSIRHVLVLTFSSKLHNCSQRHYMPNTGDINKSWFLVSGKYFLSYTVTISATKVCGQHIGGPHAAPRSRTPDTIHDAPPSMFNPRYHTCVFFPNVRLPSLRVRSVTCQWNISISGVCSLDDCFSFLDYHHFKSLSITSLTFDHIQSRSITVNHFQWLSITFNHYTHFQSL